MADLVLGASAGLTGWLLTYLLHSTVVLASAAVLMHALSLRPSARDVLLKVGLLGGVLTATAAVVSNGLGVDALHLVTEAPRSVERHSVEGTSFDRTSVERGSLAWLAASGGPTIEIRARIVEPSEECRALLRSSESLGGDHLERIDQLCASPQAAGVPMTWFVGVVGLWLVGALFGLAFTARRLPALRDLEASLTDPSPRCRRLFTGLLTVSAKAGARVRPPRLAFSDAVDTPCVLPGATVVLPARCEAELNDAELRAVLAHELAHVERRDVLWCGVLRVLTRVLWVQPLNRIALAWLVDTAEHRCDDRALERTGERVGLARSISRVAHWSLDARRPAPGVSMAGRPRGGLGERVRRILHDDPPRGESAWVPTGLSVLLVLPLLWLPAVPAPATLPEAIFVQERETVIVQEGVLVEADPAAGGPHTTLSDTTARELRFLVARIQTRLP